MAGLTNGVSYTFTVTATNSVGAGAASAASNSVVPKRAQTIMFDNPGGQTFGTSPTLTAASSSGLPVIFTSHTPEVCTVTSGGVLTFLKAGTATISASQAGGDAYLPAAAVSQSFAVNTAAPGAPAISAATAGDGRATVSFMPLVFTGGAGITGYTVTSSPEGFTATGTESPILVTGLTNGVPYTFTVTATNSAGTGAASAASSPVTPAAAPMPTPAPTAAPIPTPVPMVTPAPTSAIMPTPSPTTKPRPSSAAPTAPTVTPALEATPTPVPSATPSAAGTPSPAPIATQTPAASAHNPQTGGVSNGIGTALWWVGGGVIAAALIALLIFQMNRSRKRR